MIIWNVVLAGIAAIYFYFGRHEDLKVVLWNIWFAGAAFALFYVKTMFIQQRHFSVLKANAYSLRALWRWLLLQNAILIAFSILVLVFLCWFFRFAVEDFISPWLYMSCVASSLLVMTAMDGNQYGLSTTSNAYNMGFRKSFLIGFGSSLAFVILGWIFIDVSPLLAFCLLMLGLTFGSLFSDSEIGKSFTSSYRWKIFALFAILILVTQAVFGYCDLKFSRVPSYAVVPKATWKFTDIENVKSIEDWVYWQNKLKTLDVMTTEQIIASYDKLHMYCPPRARDNTMEVECVGEENLRDYQFTGFKNRTEEDVLKLLSASTEYSQMMGLLYARKLPKPLSRDMIVAVEYIADKEGNLQGLAKNTLSQSFAKDYRGGFVIRVVKPRVQAQE